MTNPRHFIAGLVLLTALCAGAAVHASQEEKNDSAPVSLPKSGQVVAQRAATVEAATKLLQSQGYKDVTGLVRRGENYVGQATDRFGMRVRIVMNARTGDIVGLTTIVPKKK